MDELIWVYSEFGSDWMVSHASPTTEEVAAKLADHYPQNIYFYARFVEAES